MTFQQPFEPPVKDRIRCRCANNYCAHEPDGCVADEPWNCRNLPTGWELVDTQPYCGDCLRMMQLAVGDTIALRTPGTNPVYTCWRVTAAQHLGRMRVRGFSMPAQLDGTEREIRVERFLNLRDLLPAEGADLRAGSYVVAPVPSGVRIAQLVHDFTLEAPALLLRDFGTFDFREQREVGVTFTHPTKSIFPVRSYLEAT